MSMLELVPACDAESSGNITEARMRGPHNEHLLLFVGREAPVLTRSCFKTKHAMSYMHSRKKFSYQMYNGAVESQQLR
jgi:hypothetical protein